MTVTNLEAFAIEFTKLVAIEDQVNLQKEFDVNVQVQGTSAMADAKGEAAALGDNSHTETLGLTSTTAVEGVGSTSSSIAQSVSLATQNPVWHM
jgi:hypothetical protein